MDNTEIERLKALWDGRSEYVMGGNMLYRVLTPNGKEDPVFVPVQSDVSGYGETSTGFARAPEPPTRQAPRQMPRAKPNPKNDVN